MDDGKARTLTRRQLASMGWVALLSPVIQQIPQSVLPFAGRAVWLSCLLAAPLLLGLTWLLERFLRGRRDGEGLGELYRRALGEQAGRAVLLLYALWLMFYAGFSLRAGADRFVTAVYPNSRPTVFLLTMAALGAMAVLGRLKVLSRCAQMAGPALIFIFLLVLLSALQRVRWGELLPLSRADLLPALRGALPVAETMGIVAYAAFLEGETEKGGVFATVLGPLAVLLLLSTLLCVTTVGSFGVDLAGKMTYPFFVMIRDVRFFRLLERVEALVIVQWVITDFVFLSLLLHTAVTLLRQSFPRLGRTPPVLLSVLLSTAAAFLCAPTGFRLVWLRQWVMPTGNALLIFLGMPLVWAVGKLRHTIY